ncbi:carbon catabolite repression protein CreD [Zymoseptoria brevis]|uniref:Carbon catabolite repression protein CreD n=1 Tax=Zymoseptoria brevis TaxID=1047168 RepID=A0A0F4GTK0_9PEZI|nr:carbon catabolite repression protein CreD [Zymoseptoria brevis]
MVPTPRSYTSGGSRNKATLEIIPDDRFIVFNGGEHEAATFKLTGRVRLTTPEAMSIMRPKVRLEGKRKISWWYMGGISTGEVMDKRVFWNQEQRLGIESAHKIKAGTIEWPFEFELSPTMPESVEGLRETFIAYHLHASVSRPGWNAKDITAQEHIRIVRTLGQDSMEMTRSRVNADIWANKISYSISIPTDAIVFGTSVTADVELSPIKKGITLGKVEMKLIETVVKRIQANEVPDVRGDRSKSEETEVAKAEMDFPEHSRITYDDDTTDNPTLADEMYRFQATLPLPKSLNACRQDVDSHSINITHRFKLMVNIHNPEGHVSQLVCRLPVKLFISPNLPVDESNMVCGNANGVSDAQLNLTETALVAPPEYGRHQLDQMYSDIDPSGFMSRAGSGPGTPAGLMSQSRRGSHENILSLNGLAESETLSSTNHGSAMPSLLHSRLADLQESDSVMNGRPIHGIPRAIRQHSPSGGTSPATGAADPSSPFNDHTSPYGSYILRGTPPLRNDTSFFHHSAGHSPHTSAPMSRRTSGDGLDSLHQQDYNMQDLTRVPSYGAALRTPGAVTPFTDGPPSYVEATSRPPSPPLSQSDNNSPPLAPPGLAHLRSGVSTPSSGASTSTLTRSMAGLTMTPATAGVGRRESATQGSGLPNRTHDEESRLRMLRART